MSKQLVVCASSWCSFVASLRSNLKLGYGICTTTTFKNNFYTARLQQGKDKNYIARLESVTGDERESTLDLCDYLGSGTAESKVIEQSVPEKVVKISQTEVSGIKIERQTRKPRSRGKK